MARDTETPERKTGVAAWNESEGVGRERSTGGRSKRAAAERRRRLAVVICVLVGCVLSIVCVMPIQERITRGLWFKGGTAQTMKADGDVDANGLATSVATINGRLANVGVSEYVVEASGSDSVVVKLPWNVDGKSIAESVGGAGKVEFVEMDDIGDADALTKLNSNSSGVALKEGSYTAFLDDSHITSCETAMVSDGVYAVTIHFDDEGTQKFAEVTEELAKDYGSIAIVVDGRIVATPGVSEKIDGGQVSISGGFDQMQAGALKAVIDGDKMPVSFKLATSEDIGPLAGEGSTLIIAGCTAAVGAIVAILAFVRMRKTGLLVLTTEVVLAILMLGLMAVGSRIEVFTLTIASFVAGLVACGCGVAGSWLVCSRFVGLVRSGKSVRGSSLAAAAEALNPSILPVSIVGVASLVVLFLPFPTLREIGLSLALGIIASIIAILLFEVPLLRVLATGTIQNDPAAWGLDSTREPSDT